MPIDFLCPHCQNRTLVADEYAGLSGPCSNCDATITIPGRPQATSEQSSSHNPYAKPMEEAELVYSAQPRESDMGMRMLIPVDRSVLAIIAGYFGLFSVLCFPAPLAVVFGILALRDIKKSDGKKHGKGRAWFGIIFGMICMIFVAIAFLISATSS